VAGIRTAALIPAYEAAGTVGAVVAQTRPFVPVVLVVDDGSSDDTAAVARSAGAEVVRHPRNRGKGGATRTGLLHLADRGFERVVTLDADGQHLPTEIPKLLLESDRHRDALVLAVRDKRGHSIARLNRIANWIADRGISLVARYPFQDTQCGFRIYPIAATVALDVHGERMEWDAEVLIAACRAGIPIREVVTQVYYPPISERQSHYRRVGDTVRIGWVMLRSVWQRHLAVASHAG
jgi:glycosyltransferase involved in cell wall biosynthesis